MTKEIKDRSQAIVDSSKRQVEDIKKSFIELVAMLNTSDVYFIQQKLLQSLNSVQELEMALTDISRELQDAEEED